MSALEQRYPERIRQALKQYRTDPRTGLTTHQVRERLERLGPNEVRPVTPPLPERLAAQLRDPALLLLLPAPVFLTFLGLLSGQVTVADFLLCVLMLAADLYARVSRPPAHCMEGRPAASVPVLRDGSVTEILTPELVQGDIVVLSGGDEVPADLYVLSCESWDSPGAHVLRPGQELLQGADPVSGNIRGLVFATGCNTRMAGEAARNSSQKRGRIWTRETVVQAGGYALLLTAGLLRGGGFPWVAAVYALALTRMPGSIASVLFLMERRQPVPPVSGETLPGDSAIEGAEDCLRSCGAASLLALAPGVIPGWMPVLTSTHLLAAWFFRSFFVLLCAGLRPAAVRTGAILRTVCCAVCVLSGYALGHYVSFSSFYPPSRETARTMSFLILVFSHLVLLSLYFPLTRRKGKRHIPLLSAAALLLCGVLPLTETLLCMAEMSMLHWLLALCLGGAVPTACFGIAASLSGLFRRRGSTQGS